MERLPILPPYGNHVAMEHTLCVHNHKGFVSSAAGNLSLLGLTLEKQMLQVAEERTVQSVCLSPLEPGHEASETLLAGRDRLRDSGIQGLRASGLRQCLNRVKALAQSIWDAVGFRAWAQQGAPWTGGRGTARGCG